MDRLGVAHHPVTVTPVQGAALDDLKQHLDTLEREVQHMMTAVKDMKNGIHQKNSRLLTSGVMNSRNWALSIELSHCYIQVLLGANPGDDVQQSVALLKFYLSDYFQRAAVMGVMDAIETRRRLNVLPTDFTAKYKWDGWTK